MSNERSNPNVRSGTMLFGTISQTRPKYNWNKADVQLNSNFDKLKAETRIRSIQSLDRANFNEPSGTKSQKVSTMG